MLLTLTLLCPLQSAAAAVQTTSGSTGQMGNAFSTGTTSYVVYYSYPSVALVGTNLTIALTVQVNGFSGLVEYISDYALEAQIFVGTHELNATFSGPYGVNSSSFLYPGARWGPNNVTLPLTEANTGLAQGESANATVSIILSDFVFFGSPYNYYAPEPAMEGQGGSLMIQNVVASSASSTSNASTVGRGAGQTVIPYALLASGAVLMVVAILVPRVPRPQKSNQK